MAQTALHAGNVLWIFGPIAQRLEQRTQFRVAGGEIRQLSGVNSVNGLPARATQRRAKRVFDILIHEGVEAIITHLNRQRHDEGMVQTTHRQLAAKAEVVCIILWFWVRIPVGPPFSARTTTYKKAYTHVQNPGPHCHRYKICRRRCPNSGGWCAKSFLAF